MRTRENDPIPRRRPLRQAVVSQVVVEILDVLTVKIHGEDLWAIGPERSEGNAIAVWIPSRIVVAPRSCVQLFGLRGNTDGVDVNHPQTRTRVLLLVGAAR